MAGFGCAGRNVTCPRSRSRCRCRSGHTPTAARPAAATKEESFRIQALGCISPGTPFVRLMAVEVRSDPYYSRDLALVHHRGFGFHADACAPGMLRLLEPILAREGWSLSSAAEPGR
jgi:hypothetical protein